MKTTAPLMLCSASPRRQELLAKLGFTFEVSVRAVDERIPDEVACSDAAEFLARKKASAFSDLSGQHIIITADTVVCLHGQSLAKPADREEALTMLARLSGQVHEVITGVCIFHKGRLHSFSETTRVTFRNVEEDEMIHYIDLYRPYDKAGAYGIQEWIGMMGIEKIDGDYYNVMGFPASRFWQEWKALAY